MPPASRYSTVTACCPGGKDVEAKLRYCGRLSQARASAAGVVAVYAGLLDVFLIDPQDAALADEISAQGARPVIADALMKGRRGEARLARVLLSACFARP